MPDNLLWMDSSKFDGFYCRKKDVEEEVEVDPLVEKMLEDIVKSDEQPTQKQFEIFGKSIYR